MDYFDLYKRRVLKDGATTLKENYLNEARRSFNSYLNESLTAQEHHYTKVDEFPDLNVNEKTLMAINDITNNDKKAYDEKILLVPLDVDIDVGCYIYFDNCWFLVIFKEHKSINSYKKFIIRRCNRIINYCFRGKIYRIPLCISALTLYSDGLADVKYVSYGDSKNRIAMGNNPITKCMDVGTRIMLTRNNVFRITNLTDFEYNGAFTGAEGIISALILQTATIGEDDKVNNIAFNIDSKPLNEGLNKITGKDHIYLGEQNDYSIDCEKEVEFILDFDYVDTVLVNQSNNKCTIKENLEIRNIGESIILIARYKDTKETIDIKNIIVRGV